jgi:hypothetical protein
MNDQNQNALEEQESEHQANDDLGVDWKLYHGEGKTLSLGNKKEQETA